MTTTGSDKRVSLSLGVRVAIPVLLIVTTLAIGVYLGLVRQSRLSLLSSKELAADMVVKLTSDSVVPAVVFGDQQEMQRTIQDLARNPDVSDVELWGFETSPLDGGGNGDGLLAEFHRTGVKRLGRPSSTRPHREHQGEYLAVVAPVITLEGKHVAALSVRFSTAREAAALRQLSRQILYVSLATALCLALAILIVIHRIVVRPVKQLERAATRLARGEQHELQTRRGRATDEVERLAEKFGEMAEAVRDRERRLGVRNAELKLILDSVDQGFLTARVDGSLLPERSAVVETWAGTLDDDATIWSLVEKLDPSVAMWMRGGWAQVTSDFLPLEVAVDQLPKRVRHGDRQLSLAYHPVLVDSQLQHVVIVLTDITAEMERQRALAEQHEFAALVDQFVRDRRAFRSFWSEANRLVAKILEREPASPELLRRNVHTLKGNARFFGLTRVASMCHELETAMAERREFVLTERERQGLQEVWQSLAQRIEPLLQGATTFLEVAENDYRRLVAAVTARRPIDEVAELVRGLRREPLATHLEHAKTQIEDACTRLGKAVAIVEVNHDGLRVPPGPWAPFWAVFSHVLNNAVDHGIESDEVRRSAGKSVPARVVLASRAHGDEAIVEVGDDGGGIDWERVRAVAAERGLPSQSAADLEQALFTDGFTLKRQVSETSGRGVGLAAVKNVVAAMGGRVEVRSERGKGTQWRFIFPLANLQDSSDDEAA